MAAGKTVPGCAMKATLSVVNSTAAAPPGTRMAAVTKATEKPANPTVKANGVVPTVPSTPAALSAASFTARAHYPKLTGTYGRATGRESASDAMGQRTQRK